MIIITFVHKQNAIDIFDNSFWCIDKRKNTKIRNFYFLSILMSIVKMFVSPSTLLFMGREKKAKQTHRQDSEKIQKHLLSSSQHTRKMPTCCHMSAHRFKKICRNDIRAASNQECISHTICHFWFEISFVIIL